MHNITVTLLTKPDFDPIQVIGGLAKLTQIKQGFSQSTRDKGLKILAAITAMGHTSLLECADFGFIISGASRVFLAQITRHRLASYTSQSQQYQDHDDFPFVVPTAIQTNPAGMAIYNKAMRLANEAYIELKNLGIHRDDARYVIPGAACNDLYIKMNARELITAMIPQRSCRRNTPETLFIVRGMLKALVEAGFGDLFKITGPGCVTTGKCDQGSMTCKQPFKSWEDLVYESKDSISSSIS